MITDVGIVVIMLLMVTAAVTCKTDSTGKVIFFTICLGGVVGVALLATGTN